MTGTRSRPLEWPLSALAACIALALGAMEDHRVAQAGTAAQQAGGEALRSGPALPSIVSERKRSRIPSAPRTVRTVTNCDDNGAGSLREAVLAADDNDVIDMTALTCSVISLTTGAIHITVNDLSIRGPGNYAVRVRPATGYAGRVFVHEGDGVIEFDGMGVASGYVAYNEPNRGGCIRSNGSIRFENSTALGCHIVSTNNYDAAGGALSAAGYVYLIASNVFSSTANSEYGRALGGGINAGHDVYVIDSSFLGNWAYTFLGIASGGSVYAVGNVVMDRTSIQTSYANSSITQTGYGGGIFAGGFAQGAPGTSITSSTIFNSRANEGGAVEVRNGGGSNNAQFEIINSTITGNYQGGGVVTTTPILVANSTIARNATNYTGMAAGLNAYSTTVTIQSTILANNTSKGVGDDFNAPDCTVTGGNNLIMFSQTPPPGGTIYSDPMLGMLRDNGGPTLTLALYDQSPAVDRGNNSLGLMYDQRGQGFGRTSGLLPDIGAFEFQHAPALAKAFAPNAIVAGEISVLTITLTNMNDSDAILRLDLTDVFPASIEVADDGTPETTCPGGFLAAIPGENFVTLYSGAHIPAIGSCTVAVAVTTDAAGDYTNTIPPGALQTNQGNNEDAASAALSVIALVPPTIAKAFTPATIQIGSPSVLTITLSNPNASAATLTASLTDTLPTSVVIASPPNATTTCPGGVVQASSGGGDVTLQAAATIPANGTCTLSAAVTSNTSGSYMNTIPVGALQTDAGENVDATSATLTVISGPPADEIFVNGFDDA